MNKEVLQSNKVYITGELIEYDLSIKTNADNKEYISGQVIIKSTFDENEHLIPVDFFSFKTTKQNTPNKLFIAYEQLADKVGERVSITGELQENRFYQEGSGQVISYNRVAGRFINVPSKNHEDRAEFEFLGYVVAPISERLDKDGNLIFHEITLAEQNWSGEFPIYVKFAVKNPKAVDYMSSAYQVGETVKVNGVYEIETSSEEVMEETAFGEPIKKIYTNTFRNFVIVSGYEPIEEKAYTPEKIADLETAYRERGIELEERAREGASAPTSDAPAAKRGIGKALL